MDFRHKLQCLSYWLCLREDTKVPDFTISVYGSSCILVFSLLFLLYCTVSISFQFASEKEKAKEQEWGRKRSYYMNCRTQNCKIRERLVSGENYIMGHPQLFLYTVPIKVLRIKSATVKPVIHTYVWTFSLTSQIII